MIAGQVSQLQALVSVLFRLPGRPDLTIEFVVDTGFEGALTLPVAAVVALGLPFFQEMSANLANDASVRTDVHIATILWEEQEMDVVVLAMGRRPLLGTALLNGSHLGVDFEDGGVVTIGKLS